MARSARNGGASFTLHVEAGGERIAVEVRRKRVRNLNLRVRADGSVTLSVPLRAAEADAQAMLDRRAAWIAERVHRRRQANRPAAAPRETGGDGLLPLWGRLVPAADALGLSAEELAARSPDELARRVDELYRREVARALPAAASRGEAATGLRAARWQVRRMTSRWGSCTPATGAIRIAAALAAYPPACLDAVAAHELTHLAEPSHNERFHRLLDAACPGNREVMALLKHPAREIAEG